MQTTTNTQTTFWAGELNILESLNLVATSGEVIKDYENELFIQNLVFADKEAFDKVKTFDCYTYEGSYDIESDRVINYVAEVVDKAYNFIGCKTINKEPML